MKIYPQFLLLLLLLTVGHSSAWSQEDTTQEEIESMEVLNFGYTDEQLKQFAVASKALDAINEGIEGQLIEAVQAHKLDAETYRSLGETLKANPDDKKLLKSKKMKNYLKAKEAVDAIRAEVAPQLEQAVLSTGLSIETYQDIMLGFQLSPDLKSRIYKELNALDRAAREAESAE